MQLPLRKSWRCAIAALCERFPKLQEHKRHPEIDMWLPVQCHLEAVGLLRHVTNIEDLRNQDPDFWHEQLNFASEDEDPEEAPGLAATSTQCEQEELSDLTELSETSDESDYTETSSGKRLRISQKPQPKRAKITTSKQPATVTSKPKRKRKRARKNKKTQAPATSEQAPTVPSVTYTEHSSDLSTKPFQPNLPANLSHKERQRERKYQLNMYTSARKEIANTVEFTANSGFDITEDARISKPAWMGLNASVDVRDSINCAVQEAANGTFDAAHRVFAGITKIPYVPHRLVAIYDQVGRMFALRSRFTSSMETLLPLVNEEAIKFVNAIKKPFTKSVREGHSRGSHWFSIAGHHRNNQEAPIAGAWQQENDSVVKEFFQAGRPFQRLTSFGCKILKTNFPTIAQRYQDSVNYIQATYGITAMFGLFFNWCLNAPHLKDGVKRVFCKPHVDYKNLAFGLCMIFIYGHFDHKTKCWLVIWEAGIALELPPGVFLLYPSALFLHFNIDLSHLPIVTTNGEYPTPENSKPLYTCGCESHQGNKEWAEAEGRGSIVWFNQATMAQTSELGSNSIRQAAAEGKTTRCDGEQWLKNGVFPST